MCKKLLIFVVVLGFVSSAIADHPQGILFEYWFDIGGTAIGDLTGQADYPDNPDDGEIRDKFEGNLDWRDNYGQRARGWLHPTDDGDYTFWVAGDDYCDLMLSADDNPANAVIIAQVPGWTSYQQWDAYPEQQSAPITLAAGGQYYIEALMKEGGGGDSLSVGWTGPGFDELTIIPGAYLSPADPAPSLKKARNPVPADGAVDVDAGLLEWGAGFGAVSHTVYLNGDLLGETAAGMELIAATLDPGVTYTWQVDETDADGAVWKGDEWTFTTLPLEAHFPSPADGAENVPSPVTLKWTPGKNTIINDLYVSTDKAAVDGRNMATAFKGKLINPSYALGDVELFSTYYWAVDAFTPGGVVAGPTWSFSTEKFVLIEDSITLTYDNSAEPYVSEAGIDTVADLTAGGAVSDLTLSFRGMASNLSVDEATGTYRITGEGADIWGSSDQFHYVYMQLTGDGEISARVVSNGTGSNTWAKGGVMIRESTAANSKHMIMGMTGGDGGGIAFQGRIETGANSSSLHGDVTASPPYWVKLVREGNNITAYASADGQTWDLFTDASPDNSGGAMSNPIEVVMPETVLIGLFVTSHADGENRTYTFDNIDLSGDLDGVIVSEDIASVSGNSAEPIYIAIEDLTGAVAAVTHPYASATQVTTKRAWTIPLGAFEGVDVTQAAKLYVGVGDGEPGGMGAVTFTDIKVVEPTPVAAPRDITVPGDIVKGIPDDGDWPGAEHPALAIDNNTGTKFLHFKGDFDPDPGTGGTGIKVTPLDGPSVVTGLALTTANDVPGRDPIAFKLSGSNEGINGPYELIAEGDIVDFAGENAWPRFTKNATPITFANDTAYAHYELIFTAIRGPVGGSVNSMQIAEIELLEGAGILAWEAAAAADSPGYLATNVAMGVYDIGTYGGEQTYEFVVNANPDETGASMALLGRHMQNAGNRAALKFDQWNNTGEYGATLFGVVDLYYGVAANYGVDTIATFVSSEAAGTTTLYVDGELAGSVDRAISLSGALGIGGANRDAEGAGWVDPFDGDILGVAIYDGALTPEQIAAHADAFFLVEAADAGCENILANGNFEDGVPAPWSTYGDASLEVVQDDPVEGDYCLHVTVNSAGANFWDAGLQHAGHVFEAGKSYSLSAWFKSKAGTFEINMKPERGGNPWEPYGEQRIILTEEWTEYTTNTGVIPADVDPASITFHIAFTAGEFYVDDVVFCEDE